MPAPRPLDVLLSRTQQRVLALLFAHEEERSLGELVRRSGGGSGAIQREVARMAAAGLLSERRVGNQRRFRAARSSPYYAALKALAARPQEPASRAIARRPSAALIGGRDAVLHTLARFGLSRPRVFGSVARGEDGESSDLDLLVEAGPRTSLLDLSGARNALEDLLGVTVDLVTEGDLPARIRASALAEAVPL
jgi:predicted nucleotidyltransferase